MWLRQTLYMALPKATLNFLISKTLTKMDNCVTVKMPKVKASFCAPNIAFGRINRIHIGNIGNPLTDWSDLAEWTARLDNDDETDATKIRTLHVVGSKPLPERNEIEFSLGRKAYTDSEHTLPFKVDETDDENYEVIRFLEDNPSQSYSIWYQTDKYLYGGNDGVTATLVLGEVIPESDEELIVFEGSADWEGKHPLRILNPMA